MGYQRCQLGMLLATSLTHLTLGTWWLWVVPQLWQALCLSLGSHHGRLWDLSLERCWLGWAEVISEDVLR